MPPEFLRRSCCGGDGFALNNPVLIVCGALDGGSGFILALHMSKAMNRSFKNVIFGAFGARTQSKQAEKHAGVPFMKVRPRMPPNSSSLPIRLSWFPVTGWRWRRRSMRCAIWRSCSKKQGLPVKYAIHPVAGRMPGHMNVLLAEANVPYDQLYELDLINDEFPRTDVSIVVGANDVVNPAARDTPGSPIYGMPILNVDQSKAVIVLKRSMNPGFAGVENELLRQAQHHDGFRRCEENSRPNVRRIEKKDKARTTGFSVWQKGQSKTRMSL